MAPKRAPLLLLLLLLVPIRALPQTGALEPPSTGGVAAVDRALARLSTHKRLLVVAAHPDDEDTALLTLVARGMGGESAYLSLSRGEGGQNLIGPELGVGLGLIRTRELLAARGVDGGRQFFTRAYDFGYTRSLDETLRLWPKEVLLEDAVRVIRRFRPQVVVSIFPGQPHPNHGQHQAAGVTAHEAFPLAGDPNALPQLREEGLLPWTPQETRVVPVSGSPPSEGKELAKELFAGVDTRLTAIAATVPDAERRHHAGDHLEAAQVVAERARAAVNPARLGGSAPAFVEILKHLRAAHAYLDRPEERHASELIAEKIDVAELGLAAAAGIALDATTEREALIPGETFPVQAVLWNNGTLSLAKAAVHLGTGGASQDPAPGALAKWELQAEAPSAITIPYFLRKPLRNGLYDWSEARPDEKGEPFEAPPLRARFSFTVEGVPVEIEREVVHRHRDQAVGEIRRPLRVVPRVEVDAHDELLVWPLARKEPRKLQVTLTSHAREALLGSHELLEGDLSDYAANVVGSRAYETDPALARANPRLLDYALKGGLVIVQYQQYPFVEGKFAPFPVEIARPHDRVTDETAAPTLLDPAHPVFTTPNKIGPPDWEGWVQERGLYFLRTWDPAFVPLLAFTDPDQPETKGGLLVAKLGEGRYVYTGLALSAPRRSPGRLPPVREPARAAVAADAWSSQAFGMFAAVQRFSGLYRIQFQKK